MNYDLSNLQNVTSIDEGFIQSIKNNFKDFGAKLRRLLSPTVKEMLLDQLRDARLNGRVYDAHNIQTLLQLMEKSPTKFTENDASQLYILNKCYVEFPEQIRQLSLELAMERTKNMEIRI